MPSNGATLSSGSDAAMKAMKTPKGTARGRMGFTG
jgi:hypothetical protein